MSRNSIRAERVEHNHRIMAIGRLRQTQAPITYNCSRVCLTVGKIGKAARAQGNLQHLGIDLVKHPALAGLGVVSQTACSQSYDRYVCPGQLFTVRLKELPDWAS